MAWRQADRTIVLSLKIAVSLVGYQSPQRSVRLKSNGTARLLSHRQCQSAKYSLHQRLEVRDSGTVRERSSCGLPCLLPSFVDEDAVCQHCSSPSVRYTSNVDLAAADRIALELPGLNRHQKPRVANTPSPWLDGITQAPPHGPWTEQSTTTLSGALSFENELFLRWFSLLLTHRINPTYVRIPSPAITMPKTIALLLASLMVALCLAGAEGSQVR